MKKIVALLGLGLSVGAYAHPISMEYEVETIGIGQYQYTFYLTCDTSDPLFEPGFGWSWFIFGDRFLGTSPLMDFVGNPGDLPIGPWNGYGSSGGGHNGPTLSFVLDPWYPTTTETLVWRGTASTDLAQDFLKISFLIPWGNAPYVDFFTATRRNPGGRQYCLGEVHLLNFDGVAPALPVDIEVRDSGGSPLFSTSTNLDWASKFFFEIDPAVPAGVGQISAKVTHWLRRTLTDVSIAEGGIQDLYLELINGDADPDNEVNIVDAATVATAFGSSEGDPNWNPMADLDGDEEVNLVDYSIVSQNFGMSGDE